MTRLVVCALILLCLHLLPPVGFAQSPPNAGTREILTNSSIINLSKARFREKTIISLIRTSQTAFDLSTPRLIELKKNGVNEKIITEMIERQAMFSGSEAARLLSLRDDEFFRADDDEFFKSTSPRLNPPAEKRPRPATPAPENDVPVFGSGSSSQGQTRSRGLGGNGDNASQSELGGSATVRIVRPPAETGEPKLERAA